MKRIIINPVIKDMVTFVQTAAETGHKFTELEVRLMPGGGTPIHYHKTFSETFTVLEGVLSITAGKETFQLFTGESCTVPPKQLHRFFNASQEKVRFKTEVYPGHTGFENALFILYGLAGDGLTDQKGVPKKLEHLAVVSEISEMYLPGKFKLAQPLLSFIARRARKKGVEQGLIDKYCSLYGS